MLLSILVLLTAIFHALIEFKAEDVLYFIFEIHFTEAKIREWIFIYYHFNFTF